MKVLYRQENLLNGNNHGVTVLKCAHILFIKTYMRKNCLHLRMRNRFVWDGVRLDINAPMGIQPLRLPARSKLLRPLYQGRNPMLKTYYKLVCINMSTIGNAHCTHPVSTDCSTPIFWVTLTTKQVSLGSCGWATTCFKSLRPKFVSASKRPTPLFPPVQYPISWSC